MPDMPPTHRPFGRSPVERERQYEVDRGSARERGYDSRWDKARKAYLNAHPLCAYCALEDRVAAAVLVDHLYPHRGDQVLFWDRRMWVAACADCHNGFKQVIERRGRRAIDALAVRLGLPVRQG